MIRLMTAAAARTVPLIWNHLPLPAEVDELAFEYFGLEAKVDQAYKLATELDAPLEELKQRLILTVEEFGQAAPRAAKTKLVAGIRTDILATFGLSRSVDAAAVERFRVALKQAGRTRILSKIFEERTTWNLLPGAAAVLRNEQLSDHLAAMFARCEVSKARTPTLQVRRK
jgi:hypothetical protein